jgi:hypothetical protein
MATTNECFLASFPLGFPQLHLPTGLFFVKSKAVDQRPRNLFKGNKEVKDSEGDWEMTGLGSGSNEQHNLTQKGLEEDHQSINRVQNMLCVPLILTCAVQKCLLLKYAWEEITHYDPLLESQGILV